MAIAEKTGGVPALTAVLMISTAITGACLASYVLRLVGIKEWHPRGFAMADGSRYRHGDRVSGERDYRNLRQPCDGT
jgi:putative effector of murein hydrolase